MEIEAEKRLENLIYNGEKARYNFEIHVSHHRKSHNDIAKATGTGLTEQVKVRKLITSLAWPKLQASIAAIRAQENLRTDFDTCVNYLKGQISLMDGFPDERARISASETVTLGSRRSLARASSQGPGRGYPNQRDSASGRGRAGGRGGRGRGDVGRGRGRGYMNRSTDSSVDRWYTAAEWRALDPNERERIQSIRDKRKLPGTGYHVNTTSGATTVSDMSSSYTQRTAEEPSPKRSK